MLNCSAGRRPTIGLLGPGRIPGIPQRPGWEVPSSYYTIHPDPAAAAAEPCALRMMEELTDRTQVEWQEPNSNDSMNERNALTRLTSSTFSDDLHILFHSWAIFLSGSPFFPPQVPFLPFLNSQKMLLSSFIGLRLLSCSDNVVVI